MPVRVFGEVEFGAALIKTIVVIGLILLSLAISVGGNSKHEVIGFRYWRDPGAFQEYLVTGATGRFLGFFASVINAAFAFMGSEMVGVTFGEAEKPWKTIPKAIRQTFYRISFFYIGGVLVLGMAVSPDSPRLIEANTARTGAGRLI
jgi:amino acid transporter